MCRGLFMRTKLTLTELLVLTSGFLETFCVFSVVAKSKLELLLVLFPLPGKPWTILAMGLTQASRWLKKAKQRIELTFDLIKRLNAKYLSYQMNVYTFISWKHN